MLTILIPAAGGSRLEAARATAAFASPNGCREAVFSGEVSRGGEWRAAIGMGWEFRLVPIAGPAGGGGSSEGYSGWDFVVDPVESAGYPDALLLATPPYGSLNEREIGTTYGLRAQDAIAWGPRRFHFLTTRKQLARARALYGTLMAEADRRPTGQTSNGRAVGQSVTEAASKELLAMVSRPTELGSGSLEVLDARLVAGVGDPPGYARAWASRLDRVPHTIEQAEAAGTPRGELRWMRFRAVLRFPAEWKLPPGLGSNTANCAE